jgi:hypothetical protein
MKHHIDQALILVTFLSLGVLALSSVGIIVLALEVCSK